MLKNCIIKKRKNFYNRIQYNISLSIINIKSKKNLGF